MLKKYTTKKNKIFSFLINPYLILVFLLIIFLFNSLNPLIDYDENLWSYIGRIWNRKGIPPYLGALENKTPGVFFLFAFSDYIFQGNMFFVRIIGVLATLLSTFLLYNICLKLHSKLAGIFCMLIFGLTMCWFLLDGAFFAHTEVFMVLFSILSFNLILKSNITNKNWAYVFLAGLSIGIAISFKQIALTTVLALILFFLLYSAKGFSVKNKIFGTVLIFSGCLSSILVSYIILYLNGVSLNDYLEGAWFILLNSGSKVTDIKAHLLNFCNSLLASRFIFFYFFIVLFFFQKELVKKPLFLVLVLWFVFDFIGVNASGYYYGHQIKQVIPSISIIAGIVLSNLITNNFYISRTNPTPIAFIFVIVILFFPYRQTLKTANQLFFSKPIDASSKEIGSWIKDNTSDDDYIYVLGGDKELMSALLWSDRVSSSKYFNSIFITEEKHRKAIYSDLNKFIPKIILKIENDSLYIRQVYGSTIENFLQNNYTLTKKDNGIEIYGLTKKTQ